MSAASSSTPVDSAEAANVTREDRPRAVVFGLAGPALTPAERRLFAQANPLGFILFSRNCVDRRQVGQLVAELRTTVGRENAAILIDQEGGRVARLRPPVWRAAPAPALFAAAAREHEAEAVAAVYWNARLIAADLAELGITIDCAPVLDVPQPGSHEVIGDRAVGDTPERAVLLGRAWCDGLLAGGVLPVIKHIPGHGRAAVDSHQSLPHVAAAREVLDRVDFVPFRALNHMPWAMTAHVVYEALDPTAPATTSPSVITNIIREAIGFTGVLVSDDICMGALGGPLGDRAAATLVAGCDIVLHCNGAFAEMEAVAAACGPLTEAAQKRVKHAEALRQAPQPFDRQDALSRVEALLNKANQAS